MSGNFDFSDANWETLLCIQYKLCLKLDINEPMDIISNETNETDTIENDVDMICDEEMEIDME